MNLDLMVNHMRTKGGNKSNQNSEVFYLSNMYAEGKDRKEFLLKIWGKKICVCPLPPRKKHGT